jgi:hypothetical protein
MELQQYINCIIEDQFQKKGQEIRLQVELITDGEL